MTEPIIGIDVGTSSCCMAFYHNGKAQILSNRHGYTLTPSMLAITASQKRLVVGNLAKKQAVTNPEGTVIAAKKLIGRLFNAPEIAEFRARSPYPIIAGPRGEAMVSLHGTLMTPIEITSHLLGDLRLAAGKSLGEHVSKAVITVPANYNEIQRQSVVKAALLAGFEAVRLLNEPTAAALAYGAMHSGKRRNIVIYDFGGGTFDVTILALEQDVYEVLATQGNNVGGNDCDAIVIQDWLQTLLQTENANLYSDRLALARLNEAAEQAKVTLSLEMSASIDLPFLTDRLGSPLHFSTVLSRERLDVLTEPIISSTFDTCAEALRRADLTVGDLDDVILIGGMTRMPAVQHAVAQFFQRQPVRSIHPEEAVATGAALYGASLSKMAPERILLDVVPHTLAISSANIATPIIPKGTRIPARRSVVFTTTSDNQRSVKIKVVQGEDLNAGKNVLVGVFEVDNLPPLPRGGVQIDVEFSVNTEGLLDVTAINAAGGKLYKLRVSETLRESDSTLFMLS